MDDPLATSRPWPAAVGTSARAVAACRCPAADGSRSSSAAICSSPSAAVRGEGWHQRPSAGRGRRRGRRRPASRRAGPATRSRCSLAAGRGEQRVRPGQLMVRPGLGRAQRGQRGVGERLVAGRRPGGIGVDLDGARRPGAVSDCITPMSVSRCGAGDDQRDVVAGGQLAVAGHVPGRAPGQRARQRVGQPGDAAVAQGRQAVVVQAHLAVGQVVVVDQQQRRAARRRPAPAPAVRSPVDVELDAADAHRACSPLSS